MAPERQIIISIKVYASYNPFISNGIFDVHSNVRVTEYLATISVHSGEVDEKKPTNTLIPIFDLKRSEYEGSSFYTRSPWSILTCSTGKKAVEYHRLTPEPAKKLKTGYLPLSKASTGLQLATRRTRIHFLSRQSRNFIEDSGLIFFRWPACV
jgi:hypothetical protein